MKKVMQNVVKFVNTFLAQIILVVLVIFFSIECGSAFFSYNNLISIVRQVSTMGIAALGVSFLMITGNIDFSIGATYAFTGVLAALLHSYGCNMIIAMLLAVVAGTLFSVISCFISERFNLSRLVISMAMNMLIGGLAYLICGTKTVYGLPDWIKWLGQGYVLGIPVPALIFIVLAVIVAFVLNKTYFGRCLFAVGGNPDVARLSGINVKLILYGASIICGVLASFSGLICMSRTFCGSPSAGASLSMDVISAAVLGGVSIMGGSGKTSGLVTGVLIMGVLTVGLNMMGMQTNIQDIFRGAMMLLAIILDARSKSSKAKSVD